MKRSLILLCLALGCSRDGANGSVAPAKQHAYRGSYPIRAVATIAMIGDVVRNVGGDKVQVTDLFKPGVDPHTYRPTPGDLAILDGADIVFFNGLHLEGKMDTVLEKLNTSRPSIAVGEKLFDRPKVPPLLKDDEGHNDPHVWFDVRLWAAAASVIGERLAAFDPANRSLYEKRAAEYVARLDKLHGEAHKSLQAIPKEQRVLITSHDAFQYFGRAYDVEVRGIQGINTEAEASVRDITELVEFLAKRKVKAVFVESSVNPRNMRSLIEGCAARGHKVAVGGELFSDAMGDPGTPEGTYEGMIRHNVATLLKGLN